MVLFLQKGRIIYSSIVSSSGHFSSANKRNSFRKEQPNIQGREKKKRSQYLKDLVNLDNKGNKKGQ